MVSSLSVGRNYVPDVLYNDRRIQKVLNHFIDTANCDELVPCSPHHVFRDNDVLVVPCVAASRVGSDINAAFQKIPNGMP